MVSAHAKIISGLVAPLRGYMKLLRGKKPMLVPSLFAFLWLFVAFRDKQSGIPQETPILIQAQVHIDSLKHTQFKVLFNSLKDSLNSNKVPGFFKDSCFPCKTYYHGYISSDQSESLRKDLIDSLPIPLLYRLAHHKDSSQFKKRCKDSKLCLYKNQALVSTWKLINDRILLIHFDSLRAQVLSMSSRSFVYHERVKVIGYYVHQFKTDDRLPHYTILKFSKNGSVKQYYVTGALSKELMDQKTFEEFRYTYDSVDNVISLEDLRFNPHTNFLSHVYTFARFNRKNSFYLDRIIVNGKENYRYTRKNQKKYTYTEDFVTFL